MDYIVIAIPIFFILIGLEVVISHLKKSNLYRFDDAVTNISCGIMQQVSSVFLKTIFIVGYIFVYENYRLFELNNSWWLYILLFMGVDFFYYWFHRYAHEINIFWGTHIVHHQSEEYNLTVALRQSTLQGFVSMFFYLPLALIGFNPVAFITINSFQTLYQFWIHTKIVYKLHPVIEFVFNTPSHHRVHHGRNPKYIDKNHGGTLIIFDRLFGTFQAEEEEVVYGVTKPLASWNPLWANLDWYADLWKDLKRPMRFSDRIKMLFMKPGWLPDYLGGYRFPEPVSSQNVVKYYTSNSPQLNVYILIQYIIILGATSYYLFNLNLFSRTEQLVCAGFILSSIITFGALMENKRWARIMEISRVVIFVGLIIYFYWNI